MFSFFQTLVYIIIVLDFKVIETSDDVSCDTIIFEVLVPRSSFSILKAVLASQGILGGLWREKYKIIYFIVRLIWWKVIKRNYKVGSHQRISNEMF